MAVLKPEQKLEIKSEMSEMSEIQHSEKYANNKNKRYRDILSRHRARELQRDHCVCTRLTSSIEQPEAINKVVAEFLKTL